MARCRVTKRGVPTVAEQLRAAREARKWTVYEVAEATKIKTEHVRALDEGNYHAFTAPVYIRGFVRTYATHLKLEVKAIMAQLDAELAQTEEFRDPPSLTGRPKGPLDFLTFQFSRVPWGIVAPVAILLLLITLAVLGLQAWKRKQAQDPLAGLGPGIYQPVSNAPPAVDVLPIPTAQQLPAQTQPVTTPGRR